MIIKFKEYKKSLSIFYTLVITGFYTPIIYYTVLKGQSYRIFDENTLSNFIILSSYIFIQLAILILLKNTMQKRKPKNIVRNKQQNPDNIFLRVYIGVIICGVIIYIALYFKRLPLYHALKYGVIIDRPNTITYVPNYFTFATFSNLILPGFYFYYIESIKKNNILKYLLLGLISIMLIVGGSKGLIAYVYIFIWINEFDLKVDYRIISLFIILFAIYLFQKTGGISLNIDTIKYMASSPFRRFFVTQGSGFIARLHLINERVDFKDIDMIKSYIHQVIYNTGLPGTSPTYFLGDLIVKYGYIIGAIIQLFVLNILFSFAKYIDDFCKENLFFKWNFFVATYMLGMAELGRPYFIRLFLLAVNMIIVRILTKIKKKNLQVNEKYI